MLPLPYRGFYNSTYGIKIRYPSIGSQTQTNTYTDPDRTDIVRFNVPNVAYRFVNSTPYVAVSIEKLSRSNETLDHYLNDLVSSDKQDYSSFKVIEASTADCSLSSSCIQIDLHGLY